MWRRLAWPIKFKEKNMYDIEKREPTRSSLAKQGVNAVICAGAGVGVLILQWVTKIPVVGLIVGVAACVLGIGGLLSKDRSDRIPGAIVTAAGALTLLSKIKFFAPIAGTLLSIGAIGLIAAGIFNAIKFVTGLRRKSE